MKQIIILAIVFNSFLSCKKTTPKNTNQEHPNKSLELSGVWEMTDRYFYENGVLNDSIKPKENNKNVKMFTLNKYMWSGKALPNSKEYFGYGDFTSTDTSYTAKRIFFSKSMREHAPIYTVKLELNDTIYKQIHFDSLGPYYAEKYRKIDSYRNHDSKLSIQGVWKRESNYIYNQNKIADTILIPEEESQIKIFASNKYMWIKHVPKDTVEWYGYGNYQIHKDHTLLTEKLEYTSNSMTNYKTKLELTLILEKNKFSQIHKDQDGNTLYSENYIRIE